MRHIFGHVLGRLEKVRYHPHPKGPTWSACCPAHNDRHPSLFMWVGRTGALMACCKSRGCDFESIVRATGTKRSDWFPPKTEREETERGRRKMAERSIVATYDYCDEMGVLLYQKVRYNPKAFGQRRPATPADRADVPGQWIYSLEGVRRVIYRLPELIAAQGQPVICCEGEKDVESVRKLGLVATCSDLASQWHPDYGQWLRGRRVAILPDRDEAGERYCQQVVGSLVMWGAASIRVVRLPGLADGGDVSDWLAPEQGKKGGDLRTALLTYIKAAPEWVRLGAA